MTTASPVSPRMRRFIMAVDRLVLFMTKHWLALTIIFLSVFAGLPVLAPVLEYAGWTGIADLLYKIYGLTCHQLAYRSYFFFGEQPAYNLAQLQTALHVDVPGSDVFYWRDFIGNPQLGYKMAWCERDAAMYFSLILSAIVFIFIRTRLKPLDWRIYILFLVPMAIDGTWQLLTSPNLLIPFLPVHESDPLLRGITGILFGIGSVWLIFPYIEEAMHDAAKQAQSQWERAVAREREENRTAFSQGK